MNGNFLAWRDDTRSKEADEFVRKNGFSLPLNIFQILSFFIYIIIIVLIIFISASIIEPLFLFFYVAFAILVVAIFILSYKVTIIDPVDPLSFKYINTKSTDEQVKDLYHCTVCGFVDSKSKHCKVCNKCVAVFDHHCMWVNNCVGVKNYKYFVALLSVLTMFNCLVSIFCIIYFVNALTTETVKNYWKEFYGSYNSIVFYVLLSSLFILNGIIFILLLQLLGLHIFLMKKKMTTYEYVVNRGSEENKNIRTFFEWIVVDKKRLKKSKEKKKDIENLEAEQEMTVKDS